MATQIGGQPPRYPNRGDRWASKRTDILWEFDGKEWKPIKWDHEQDCNEAYERAMKIIT